MRALVVEAAPFKSRSSTEGKDTDSGHCFERSRALAGVEGTVSIEKAKRHCTLFIGPAEEAREGASDA